MTERRINEPKINIDRVFHALGDPTRRAILDRLTRGPLSVSRLAEPLNITLTAVVQHLQVLEESGLVFTEKLGRVRTCRIDSNRGTANRGSFPSTWCVPISPESQQPSATPTRTTLQSRSILGTESVGAASARCASAPDPLTEEEFAAKRAEIIARL